MPSSSNPSKRFRKALYQYGKELPAPHPEHHLHKPAHLVKKRNVPWRFDFAWPEQKVAVEIQGGTFTRGRHSRGKGQHNDYDKFNHAQMLGWKVILLDSYHLSSIRRRRAAIDLLRNILNTTSPKKSHAPPTRLPSRSDIFPSADYYIPLSEWAERIEANERKTPTHRR